MAFPVRMFSFYEGKPCTKCHSSMRVGQAIERCLVTGYPGRKVYGFKHAYAKDCAPRAQGNAAQRAANRAK